MILIHWAILGQKLCKEIAHDVILFKSHPFQSVRKCRKDYEESVRKGYVAGMTSAFLSYVIKYIVDSVEVDSENDNSTDSENEVDSDDGPHVKKVCQERDRSFAGHLEATTNLPPHIRMRWTLNILDKCDHSDHCIKEKSSTETFLTLRDCIVNFWNSQFERFNGGINYEIVISLVH